MPTVKFYTLGCKVNQYDTQAIREQFIRSGYRQVTGRRADIFLINTCTVTERADNESLRLIRKTRQANPRSRIIVTGCLAELDAEKIKAASGVDLVVKNRDKTRILKRLNGIKGDYLFQANKGFGISSFFGHTRAFLKVQDGCNNYCAFCKVPFVRGEPKSRSKKDAVAEARRLVKSGHKEIVLTGICLGFFGDDLKPKDNLINLLKELEQVEGLERLRLSSIEPQYVSGALIALMAKSKKICRHLHIPLQSGDDEILKKMRRRYDAAAYFKLIKEAQKNIPGIAITTDCLVGFPGEQENNFRHTLDLVKKVQPLKVHIFPYSRREGTAASRLKEEVNKAITQQRIARLKVISEECAINFKEKFIGKNMPVLVEGRFKEYPGCWEGLTDNYLKVLLKNPSDLRNRFITIKLTRNNLGLK